MKKKAHLHRIEILRSWWRREKMWSSKSDFSIIRLLWKGMMMMMGMIQEKFWDYSMGSRFQYVLFLFNFNFNSFLLFSILTYYSFLQPFSHFSTTESTFNIPEKKASRLICSFVDERCMCTRQFLLLWFAARA